MLRSLLILCLISAVFSNVNHTLEEDIELEEMDASSKGLSRRRRYLIYPSGSSFQVVFCLTAGSFIGIADIFFLGATAALALQLPSKPWHPKKMMHEAMSKIDGPTMDMNGFEDQPEDNTIDRITNNVQPYSKEKIQRMLDYEKSYKQHTLNLLNNPIIAKRSINEAHRKKLKKKRATVMKVDRKAMHDFHSERKHLNPKYVPTGHVELHRSTRSILYEKIERVMRGLGFDGRDCVLKYICEIGQGRNDKQGTFLDEIMRAIFTLHPGDKFESMYHHAYDEAFATEENCSEKYSSCTSSLKTMPLR